MTANRIEGKDDNRTGGSRPAVFLDRDGTVNVERDYLRRVADFAFLPGVPEAIRRLKAAGYLVFIVTNQSGVARGYFDLTTVDRIHRHLQQELLGQGTRVDGFYVCPHHPSEGHGPYLKECECRKGRPGLLLRAAAEHGVDPGCSYMIGDKVADIEAGRRAGCMPLLVLSGYGARTAAELGRTAPPTFAGLPEAVEFILKRPCGYRQSAGSV